MSETLWRLVKWSKRLPNCLSRRRVFGSRAMSLEPQLQDILNDGMPRFNGNLMGFTAPGASRIQPLSQHCKIFKNVSSLFMLEFFYRFGFNLTESFTDMPQIHAP